MSATKRRKIGREKRARRYFSGGVMPDGLEMFALDGGKLEIMQEFLRKSHMVSRRNLRN